MTFTRWHKRLYILACLPPIAAGFVAWKLIDIRANAAQAPQKEYVDAPADWVAFRADITITHPDAPVTRGRYFRSSDGSYRRETGPSLQDIRVIDIVNIPQQTQYVFSSKSGWMAIPHSGGEKPRRWPRQLTGLRPYAQRLAIRKGETGDFNATSGLVAFAHGSTQGIFRLLVPELNMFEVLVQRADGRREAYTDIELTSSPQDVFFPPSGVAVNYRDNPTIANRH